MKLRRSIINAPHQEEHLDYNVQAPVCPWSPSTCHPSPSGFYNFKSQTVCGPGRGPGSIPSGSGVDGAGPGYVKNGTRIQASGPGPAGARTDAIASHSDFKESGPGFVKNGTRIRATGPEPAGACTSAL